MFTTILVIGLMGFLAHFLTLQFRKTNIPDVLVLIGILIGPALGIVTPEDFGKIGSLIATIALVQIFTQGTVELGRLFGGVLASLVFAAVFGVAGGEVIRDTTYMVVLVSITLAALLVIAYPTRIAQHFYARAIGKSISSGNQGS
ncbi:MAG: hypothetical protein ACOY9D_08765 [Pseudomonadota bacterium]